MTAKSKQFNCLSPLLKGLVIITLITVLAPITAKSQYVNIPDSYFKSWILANIPHSASPTEITFAEAAAYTGGMNISGLGIFDLDGLSAFTSLTSLNCSNLPIGFLDVSNNKALVSLDCHNSHIVSTLYLTVAGDTSLTNLNCSNCYLSSLDVSANKYLVNLDCNFNQITSLDLSNNPLLTNLDCSSNDLTSLDLSADSSLVAVSCGLNNILSLDIRNGNNTNITSFDAMMNWLSCIDVDDVAYATANWASIDPGVVFSTNCATVSAEEIANETNFTIYPNPARDSFTISFPNKSNETDITIYNSAGKKITEKKVTGSTSTQINTQNFSNGIYTLKMFDEKNVIVKKLIVD